MTQITLTTPEEMRLMIREEIQSAKAAAVIPPEARELDLLQRKQLLTPKEVEKLYGLKAGTLANKRGAGRGPEYIQEGQDCPIYYEHGAIRRYLDACRKKSYE